MNKIERHLRVAVLAVASIALSGGVAQAVIVIDTDTDGIEWLLSTSEGTGSVTYEGNMVSNTIDRNGQGDVNMAPWSREVVGQPAYGFIQYRVDGAGAELPATSTGTWTFLNLAAGEYDVATGFNPRGGSNIRYTVNGAEVFVDQSTLPAANAGPTFDDNVNGQRPDTYNFITIGSAISVAEGGSITITVDNSNNIAGQRTIMDSVGITVSDTGGGDDLFGDYNDDNTVDLADYTIWRNNLGTTNILPNDDFGGTIGADQYNQWRGNFGATGTLSNTTTAAVPEPSTMALVGLALIGLVAARQSRS